VLQNTNENISPSVLNRLIKEVKEYSKNPVADIVLHVNEENVTDIRAEISGPGTPRAEECTMSIHENCMIFWNERCMFLNLRVCSCINHVVPIFSVHVS
jgi:hypothetical protein